MKFAFLIPGPTQELGESSTSTPSTAAYTSAHTYLRRLLFLGCGKVKYLTCFTGFLPFMRLLSSMLKEFRYWCKWVTLPGSGRHWILSEGKSSEVWNLLTELSAKYYILTCTVMRWYLGELVAKRCQRKLTSSWLDYCLRCLSSGCFMPG